MPPSFSAPKNLSIKCQYSVTQQWLEFDDVTLDLSSSDASAGCFALRPRRRIALLEHATMPWMGPGGTYDTKTLQKPILGFVFGEKGLIGDLSLEGSKITKIEK